MIGSAPTVLGVEGSSGQSQRGRHPRDTWFVEASTYRENHASLDASEQS